MNHSSFKPASVEWADYKTLCDRPDHWSRWMLEQCIDLLGQLGEKELRALLQDALQKPPLALPDDHKGAAATHMFQLALTQAQRQAVLRAITRAQQLGLSTRSTQARGLGGFLQAWQEYVAYGD